MKRLTIVLIAALTIFASCKKDPAKSSRMIRYEITGSFTGSLIASYTTASGGTANEPVASIPWSKEIVYASNVTAAVIAVSGNAGVTGQQVTVVVKRGGNQVSATVATADAAGSFSKSTPTVTF